MIQEFMNKLDSFSNQTGKNVIANIEELKFALLDLNKVIGLENVKKNIVSSIKCICANHVLSGHQNDPSNFLHMIFSGPPGIGKTSIACIVSRIWNALGILKTPEQVSIHNNEVELITNSIKLNKLRLSVMLSNVKKVNTLLSKCLILEKSYTVNKILKEISEEVSEVEHDVVSSFQTLDIVDKLRPEAFQRMVRTQSKYKSYKRSDLIGKYLGETAIKTQKALEEGLGGVVLIDEAYELYNSHNDSYGMECLNTINRFMSEHASEIIIIFVGYKDKLEETVFNAQPGLKRRFGVAFDFDKYSSEELSKIFRLQFSEISDCELPDDLSKFFVNIEENYPHYGGDTQRFAQYVKRIHSENNFNLIVEGKGISKLISNETLSQAFEELKDNLKRNKPELTYFS